MSRKVVIPPNNKDDVLNGASSLLYNHTIKLTHAVMITPFCSLATVSSNEAIGTETFHDALWIPVGTLLVAVDIEEFGVLSFLYTALNIRAYIGNFCVYLLFANSLNIIIASYK